MARYAEELRAMAFDHAALAKAGKYIRVLGESVRLISIDSRTPLMQLEINGAGLGSTKTLANLIPKIGSSSHAEPSTQAPGEERTLQAYLIKSALSNGRSMMTLFPELSACGIDDLVFVCDEISMGDRNTASEAKTCRADIIALGRKGDTYFPVYVELKYARSLGRLLEQLDNIERETEEPDVRSAFVEFLNATTGIANSAIDVSRGKKMLVWPRAAGAQSPRVAKAIEDDIIVIGYQRNGADFTFERSE